MACLIAAPSSNSGKTLLSLMLISWARSQGKSLQPFKVGPDYLDPQLLTLVSQKSCRNLDSILCGHEWVQESFSEYGSKTDFTLVEGVMGLFDGLGSTNQGSSADIAKKLGLPIVLIINAQGQAASIAALIKGFRDQDPNLRLAGVVLNNVNTLRHKTLLREVLDSIEVKLLGCLPTHDLLILKSRHLGLAPAHEIEDIERRRVNWAKIAELNLDLKSFEELLQAPPRTINHISKKLDTYKEISNKIKIPIALAEDKAFHFRYPETKEFLEALGFQILTWKPTEDESIPTKSKGLILPGGFPEQYAEVLSQAKRTLTSLREFFSQKQNPIYAECGGMLLLGNTLTDLQKNKHLMAGIIPFEAEQGNLQVGYRKLRSLNDSLILRKDDQINGHEFHRWKINFSHKEIINNDISYLGQKNLNLTPLWSVKGWNLKSSNEGWGNKLFHASWIHLHWPSSKNILNKWKNSFHT